MVDIFDEVSEDLRNERALQLGRRYGGALLGACLLVLLAVAGQQAYVWYVGQQNQKAAMAYIGLTGPIDAAGNSLSPAQMQGDAKNLEDFAAHAPEGYKTLAYLRAAALQAGAGNAAQAEALWQGVADDSAADQLLRDLATLLWAQHAMGSAPDAQVLARLQPLEQNANAYHGLAREAQALIYVREGKTDLAKALLGQIAADPNAPESVRNRADGLLAKLNG